MKPVSRCISLQTQKNRPIPKLDSTKRSSPLLPNQNPSTRPTTKNQFSKVTLFPREQTLPKR